MKWDQIAAVPHRMYNYLSLDINVLQDLHDKRLKDDPDLLHMTQELELFSRERENKQLSLNFQQRLDKKERYEADLLTLENNRRETKGLPVFASYEAWHPEEEQTELDIADDKDKPEKDDVVLSERDPLLYETGKVFVDYLNLGRQTHSMLVEARRQ